MRLTDRELESIYNEGYRDGLRAGLGATDMPKSNCFVLVYQAGIANLFRVPTSNVSAGYDRLAMSAAQRALAVLDTERVYQGDFRTAEAMARGMLLCGADVRVASCNRSGDIAGAPWMKGLADCPFRTEARPPRKAA